MRITKTKGVRYDLAIDRFREGHLLMFENLKVVSYIPCSGPDVSERPFTICYLVMIWAIRPIMTS